MPSATRTPPARGPAPARDDRVLVRVPADQDYVVLIRSAVGHLGARLGCTVPEIDDLRLAVDEACALLLGARPAAARPGDGVLECSIGVRADRLDIVVTAPPGDVAVPQPGGLGWSMLAALVDELSWTLADGSARIELVKGRPARAG